jgi:hypothetical protein
MLGFVIATKQESQMITFESHIQGIPCQVEVLDYSPFRDNMRGHIDSWLPNDEAEIELEILDRKGYKAEWLKRKMNQDDWNRIETEAEQAIEREANEY